MPKKKYEKELPNKSGSISIEAWSDVHSGVTLDDFAEEYSEEIAKGDTLNNRSEIAEKDEKRS